MKKEIKKLGLCKLTISNLTEKEMNQKLGGISWDVCMDPKKKTRRP